MRLNRSTSLRSSVKAPTFDEIDAHVRHVMHRGLDGLAANRRFPILGWGSLWTPKQLARLADSGKGGLRL